MSIFSDHRQSFPLLRRLAFGIHWRSSVALERVKPRVAALSVAVRWARRKQGRPHGLKNELIVSLTSYPPRFGTLALTLRCLLMQTVRPDRVILWIAEKDQPRLSSDITGLQQHGLDIRLVADIGPYKKIIPALRAFPCATIVTADDDLYYWPRWLEELLDGWDGRPKLIVCHRAHKIELDSEGHLLPYRQWSLDVERRYESVELLPTGVGGVLYPPSSLTPQVLDEDMFLSLSPRNDDLWLYWMGRRSGATYKTIARRRNFIYWPGSQDVGLFQHNVHLDKNDEQLGNLVERLGFPGFRA
jgi:hypothetical protein